MSNMVFVVIPVLNRWSFTFKCIQSLLEQDYKKLKVVIVDHGSTDGTLENIASQFPSVVLLNGNLDMWWSAAVNLGISHAMDQDAEFIVTLNNDTVPKPDFISRLVDAYYSAPEFSLIGATGLNTNDKPVFRGEVGNWFFMTHKKYVDLIQDRPNNGLIPVHNYPGRGLLIHQQVFKTIGYFDEKTFPHYYADHDFTIRAYKAGFEVYNSWDACLTIYPEQSGANEIKKTRSIPGLKKHLFSRKGAGNINDFYQYSKRHAPWFLFPYVVSFGIFKRTLGYILK